jgi:hypothetical protein
VFYTLTGALKAAGLDKATSLRANEGNEIAAALSDDWQIECEALHRAFPAVGEGGSGEDAARCGVPAPTLEAEIGALIREAGDSLRGAPSDAPQTTHATRSPGQASNFNSVPTDLTVRAASAWDGQIGTGSRDDDLRFRVILTTGVLLAAVGFAWISGLSPYRFFSPLPSHHPLNSSSAPSLGSEHVTTRLETGGDVAPSTKNFVTPTTPRFGRGQESLHGAAQPAAAPRNSISKVARQTLASAGPPQAAAQQKVKTGLSPAPTPETRPTTIPGWAVREVVGGTAVLEGPNGTLKVTRGNAAPGLGRIDSIVRWGNRWIVATSRGLITTQ